jgi:hypothetical protein
MNDLERTMRAAAKHGWCSKLSCTTCPRAEWSDALWAAGNGIRLDIGGRPTSPMVVEKPQADFLSGEWPQEVQRRLLAQAKELDLQRLSSELDDWWLGLGLIHATLRQLDVETRGFTDWVVPELLAMVSPQSAAAQTLGRLQADSSQRIKVGHLWAVVEEQR